MDYEEILIEDWNHDIRDGDEIRSENGVMLGVWPCGGPGHNQGWFTGYASANGNKVWRPVSRPVEEEPFEDFPKLRLARKVAHLEGVLAEIRRAMKVWEDYDMCEPWQCGANHVAGEVLSILNGEGKQPKTAGEIMRRIGREGNPNFDADLEADKAELAKATEDASPSEQVPTEAEISSAKVSAAVPQVGSKWVGKLSGDVVEVVRVTPNGHVDFAYPNPATMPGAGWTLEELHRYFEPIAETPGINLPTDTKPDGDVKTDEPAPVTTEAKPNPWKCPHCGKQGSVKYGRPDAERICHYCGHEWDEEAIPESKESWTGTVRDSGAGTVDPEGRYRWLIVDNFELDAIPFDAGQRVEIRLLKSKGGSA